MYDFDPWPGIVALLVFGAVFFGSIGFFIAKVL